MIFINRLVMGNNKRCSSPYCEKTRQITHEKGISFNGGNWINKLDAINAQFWYVEYIIYDTILSLPVVRKDFFKFLTMVDAIFRFAYFRKIFFIFSV